MMIWGNFYIQAEPFGNGFQIMLIFIQNKLNFRKVGVSTVLESPPVLKASEWLPLNYH